MQGNLEFSESGVGHQTPDCFRGPVSERSNYINGERFRYVFSDEKKRALVDSRDLSKSWLIFLGFHLFNMYREDTSTLTHLFNLNDSHMQMSYI